MDVNKPKSQGLSTAVNSWILRANRGTSENVKSQQLHFQATNNLNLLFLICRFSYPQCVYLSFSPGKIFPLVLINMVDSHYSKPSSLWKEETQYLILWKDNFKRWMKQIKLSSWLYFSSFSYFQKEHTHGIVYSCHTTKWWLELLIIVLNLRHTTACIDISKSSKIWLPVSPHNYFKIFQHFCIEGSKPEVGRINLLLKWQWLK